MKKILFVVLVVITITINFNSAVENESSAGFTTHEFVHNT